jgi:hypothetical protein
MMWALEAEPLDGKSGAEQPVMSNLLEEMEHSNLFN